jgi:Phosphotransferase system mannitol/fructose-specific IIA domain (Ntr-type)
MSILSNAIKKDLILLDCDAEDSESVICQLADILHEKGYVKDTYKEGVSSREKIYPTGLLLQKYSVAIPHTDTKHVNQPAVIIARLKKPVKFQYMADPKQDVMASIVMMLAIKNPSEQVPVLSAIMDLISNEANRTRLMEAKDVDEFYHVFTDIQ